MSDDANAVVPPPAIHSEPTTGSRIASIDALALRDRAAGYASVYDELRRRLEMGDV